MVGVVRCRRVWPPGYQRRQERFGWRPVSYSAVGVGHEEVLQSHSVACDIVKMANVIQRL
jgi:hypothetical protein